MHAIDPRPEGLDGLNFIVRAARWAALLIVATAVAGCTAQPPEQMLAEAISSVQGGDILTAELKYENYLKKYPEHEFAQQARFMLVNCYFQDKDYAKCLELLADIRQRAGGVNSQPGFQASGLMMDTYLAQGKPDQALEEALETSRTLSAAAPVEGWFSLWLKLARIHRAADHKVEAREAWRQALRLDLGHSNEFLRAPVELAMDYMTDEQTTAGLRVIPEYLAAHPESELKPQLLFEAGQMEKRYGDAEIGETLMDQSESAYQESIARADNPDLKGTLLIELAARQRYRGKGEAAREKLREVLEQHPNLRGVAQNMLVESLAADRRFDDATSILQHIIDQDPGSPGANNAYRQILRINEIQAQLASTSGTQTASDGSSLSRVNGLLPSTETSVSTSSKELERP